MHARLVNIMQVEKQHSLFHIPHYLQADL